MRKIMLDTRVRRAVFLDRDGTINCMVYDAHLGLPDSPQNAESFQLLEGAAQGIRLLNDAGLVVVAISNQPGIAKGKSTLVDLQAVTEKMHRQLSEEGARLDAVYYCLHHPHAAVQEYRQLCDCRKPKPGLLLRAAAELGVNLSESFMIGDQLTDMQAGRAVGCTTIYLDREKSAVGGGAEPVGGEAHFAARDLLQAAKLIRQMVSGSTYDRVGKGEGIHHGNLP